MIGIEIFVAFNLFILIFVTAGSYSEAKANDESLGHIYADWAVPPFYSVNLRKECDADEEVMFSTPYGGTQSRENCAIQTSGCVQMSVPPTDMDIIHGEKICGKRGGPAFKDVARPNLTTGMCPPGTSRCSKNTPIETTTCYPEDQTQFCPITQFFFKDILSVYYYTKSPYKSEQGFTNGQIMVHSNVVY